MTPFTKHLCRVAPVLALLTISTGLAAQEAPGDTVPDYVLDPVTVTTTRSSVDRTRIPQKIEVITRAELERSPATNVSEALRQNAAIDIIEYPGLLSGISIRGFRPQYTGINPRTLILLDGRPAGTNNLTLLALSDVERIEILRGPASALYGSNAMGGVVNVITRRTTSGFNGRGRVGYGSFGGYEAALTAGGLAGAGFDMDLSASFQGQGSGYTTGSGRTFGSDSLLKKLPDGSTTFLAPTVSDTSISFAEYRSRSASARLGYSFGGGWRVDVRGEGYLGDRVQNPGDLNVLDYDPRSLKDVSRHSVDATVSGAFDAASPSLRVFRAKEEVDYFNAPDAPNFVNFRTPVTTRGIQLQDVLRLGAHELTVGADYTSAEARSLRFNADGSGAAPFSPNSAIRSAALFAQVRLALMAERLVVTGGGRLDRVALEIMETPNLAGFPPNTERDLVLTPSVGARYSLTSALSVYGNYGRAFVTPDAFNVAGYSEQRAGANRRSVRVTRGNPELGPETSTSFDVGGIWSSVPTGFEVELTYFTTDVADRITSRMLTSSGTEMTAAGDTVLSTMTYVNVDEARIRGVEGSFSFAPSALRGLRVHANGTRIFTAEERFTATDRSQRIRNVAELTLIGGVTYQLPDRFDVGVSGRYVGERVDADYVAWWAPGEIVYPEYLVFDASLGVSVASRYRLGIELRNLTDEDYFEVRGYNLPGRSARLVGSLEL